MITTLNQIRAHRPCPDGWAKLLKHLGKTIADDASVSIVTILDSNGLDDALWCLRAVENKDKAIRLYAVWCARQVQHLVTDPRSLVALDVAERFAYGQATREDLSVANAAAETARRVAWATKDAAWATKDAAGAATWAAAKDAANAAVGAAAKGAAAGFSAKASQVLKLRELCK